MHLETQGASTIDFLIDYSILILRKKIRLRRVLAFLGK